MAEFLKQSLLFPVIESVHLIGLTMLVGTIGLVDLRLLGFGMRRHKVADLASRLAPWTRAGFLAVVVTGPIMLYSDLPRYLSNPAFLLKVVLLPIALAAHFTIHRRVVSNGSKQKLAAVLSLILWSSVVLAGRAIADFDVRPY